MDNIKRKQMDAVAAYREAEFEQPILKQLFFELTIACNEHCRHCGSSCGDVQIKDALTKEQWMNIVDDVARDFSKKPFIAVTGGEPLLNKDFFEIMNHVHDKGFKWGMTSNGVLIDKETAKKLKEAGMSTVSISLDGTKENHEWLRQVPGCYEKTLDGIRNLVEVGFKNVMVTTVVYKKNYGELDKIREVVESLGCNTWRLMHVDPIGRAIDNEDMVLDDSEYVGLIEYMSKLRRTGLDVSYTCNYYLGETFEHEIRSWYYRCISGIEVASICYNGDIVGCLDIARDPRVLQGNILKDNLKDVWENRFKPFRRHRGQDCEMCRNCSEVKYCDGGGFHTWNLDKNEPNICIYNKLKAAGYR